jgi:hypothetical protein
MKRTLNFLRRNLLVLICGGLFAMVASEVFPVLSIGFWRVTYASRYAIGHVGIGGSPATESLLSARIAAAPTASLSYRLMYSLGNAQGKAYAVMGLRHVDWTEFEQLRDDFALRSGTVAVHSGCVVTSETFESAAIWMEGIHYGDDRLRNEKMDHLRTHFEMLRKQKAEMAH